MNNQPEIRIAEAGRPLTDAAVNIDTGGSRAAPGERATMTSLHDAKAQLVKALTGFDRLGMGVSPLAYRRKIPLNKSERETAALTATAVLEAAEAVEQVARDTLDAATSRMGEPVDLMIRANIIRSLMLEVVRTLLRAMTRTVSPVEIAALVFQAKYLAGMLATPHGAEPPDHEDETEAA